MALNFTVVDELFQKGFALHQAGRMAEAERCYRDLLRYKPDHADTWHCLGLIAHHMGRNDIAVNLMNQAINLKPEDPYIKNNLGEVYRALGRGGEALASYEAALKIQPNTAVFYNNMGIVYALLGRMDEAIAAWRRAIELMPTYPEAHNNLGNVFLEQGLIEEAVACHRKAVELAPTYTAAHSNLLRDLNHLKLDGAEMRREHEEWWAMQCKGITPGMLGAFKGTRDPERPLKIGYMSPDFREHSVAFFFEPILERHDKSQFQAFCYAHVGNPDPVTQRLAGHAASWRSVVGLTDEELAKQVREDEIDILVDLAGHTASNRVRACAWKAAPVQVSYLGYPFTTGGKVVDYKITDGFADPEGMTEGNYTEGLLRLSKTAWCYRPVADTPEVNELPARQRGTVTFGSFNSYAKVSQEVVAMWAAILKRVAGSRMILKANGLGDPMVQKLVRGMFAKEGVGAERVELFGKEPTTLSHLARYGEVDIALDTFPYHGTTTTCEAMWMGVPVVTEAGKVHISRVGVSLLSNVGLPELIAKNKDEYVEIAVGLAQDLDKLAALRRGLRARMKGSPLMDEAGYVRDVEAAFRRIWREWCAKNK